MKSWLQRYRYKLSKYNEGLQQRQGARARLPGWMTVLMPLVFLSVSFGLAAILIWSAARLYQVFHPGLPPLFLPETSLTLAQGLILLPSFLAGTSLSIAFSNLLLWLIPPVRKMLDENAKGVPGASFKDGMRAGKLARVFIALPAMFLILLGIWAPWAQ